MSPSSPRVIKSDLVHPDLCYKILGVLFEVWTTVGCGHKEKIYQNAVAVGLKNAGFDVKEQLPAKVVYKGKTVGIYYFDFLINDKIVLELKVRDYFSVKDIRQLYSYLKVRDLKLGIIAHFTKTGVKHKRVVNIK
jgi:GxxExxY protein